MTQKTFLGHAPDYKQSRTYTIAGTWVASETVTFTLAGIEFVVTIGSLVTPAQVATTIKQAWNNETLTDTAASAVPAVTGTSSSDGGAQYIAQLSRLTATVNGADVTLTGVEAGESVPLDLPTTSSAAGTITPGTLTAARGQSSLAEADNFSPNAVLATDDELILDSGETNIEEGLDLDPIQLSRIIKYASYTGRVGLAEINRVDPNRPYSEPREQAPKTVHDGGVGVTALELEVGDGNGSGLFRWNFSNGKFIATVYKRPQRVDAAVPCTLLRGTHADNELYNIGGDVGIAFYDYEATTLKILSMGSGEGSVARTYCGYGATLTDCTISVNGGTLITNSALCTTAGSILLSAGEIIHQSGDIKNLTVLGSSGIGGVWRQRCGGAWQGTVHVRGGKLDLSQCSATITPAAAIQLYDGAVVDDPNRCLAVNTQFVFNCPLDRVRINIGSGRTLQIAA